MCVCMCLCVYMYIYEIHKVTGLSDLWLKEGLAVYAVN